MRTCITIRVNNGEQLRVMPRWRGRNLAVHAPVSAGVCQRQDGRWVITHLATGSCTGGQFYGTLQEAIKAARFWDSHFSQVTAENASRWPLREQWKRIISRGRAERPWRSMARVAELLGA